MRLLIVEDNERLGSLMKRMCEEEGYVVDWVRDGVAGERYVRTNPPDMLLLDRMLPEKDGVAVCQSLRAEGVHIPVLLITAMGETDERVEGLDAGADDYLVKPFEMDELLARVRALLRRPSVQVPEQLTAGDLELLPGEHALRKGGKDIELTSKEFSILEYFMRNPDTLISRQDILDHCWDFAYNPFSNIVEVYIRQLRKKIQDDDKRYIETVRGRGYRFSG